MSPTRIVILGVLFYLLYRLLTGSKKNVTNSSVRQETGNGVDDVLMEDPVCHVLVPQKEARSVVRDGKTYYFCSDKCKKIYLEKGAEK